MSDERFAMFVILSRKVGQVLAYNNLYPPDIVTICYDYVTTGCKSRNDYEYMVDFLVENKDVREELLKWVELRKAII